MHVIEIWLYALAYVACGWLDIGILHGATTLLDYVYYSAVVYTTLGFGDIIPLGPAKILTAMESLIGLGFITWSASFTFLEMQRYWRDDARGSTTHLRK